MSGDNKFVSTFEEAEHADVTMNAEAVNALDEAALVKSLEMQNNGMGDGSVSVISKNMTVDDVADKTERPLTPESKAAVKACTNDVLKSLKSIAAGNPDNEIYQCEGNSPAGGKVRTEGKGDMKR